MHFPTTLITKYLSLEGELYIDEARRYAIVTTEYLQLLKVDAAQAQQLQETALTTTQNSTAKTAQLQKIIEGANQQIIKISQQLVELAAENEALRKSMMESTLIRFQPVTVPRLSQQPDPPANLRSLSLIRSCDFSWQAPPRADLPVQQPRCSSSLAPGLTLQQHFQARLDQLQLVIESGAAAIQARLSEQLILREQNVRLIDQNAQLRAQLSELESRLINTWNSQVNEFIHSDPTHSQIQSTVRDPKSPENEVAVLRRVIAKLEIEKEQQMLKPREVAAICETPDPIADEGAVVSLVLSAQRVAEAIRALLLEIV